jgi:uncharacterized protein (TIGR03437 family)
VKNFSQCCPKYFLPLGGKSAIPVTVGFLLTLAATGWAQTTFSGSAYRALGQADLRQNGLNRVEGTELFAPGGLAIDAREGMVRLYVSDTQNHRILAWADARAYQAGDPPTSVLGQPSPQRSQPLGIGSSGLNSPGGLAVEPFTGNLYVADTGNNRVLRFPAPFANPRQVEPDVVYGQLDFESRTPNTHGLGADSLNAPAAVAFDSTGNLWVADTGNHRILRYSSSLLEFSGPEASQVVGQPDFRSAEPNRGAGAPSGNGLNRPSGLALDRDGNLYVSDAGNARVLRFPAPATASSTASEVFGQNDFSSGVVPDSPGPSTLTAPAGLAISPSGQLFVAVPADNRVMVFSPTAARGSSAVSVLGQSGFTSSAANSNVAPRASANTLSAPADVKTDPQGNIYVADSGNNRVLSYSANSRSAAQVWGQLDFVSNGANQVKASGMSGPYRAAIDYSRAPYALYLSDTENHRVLVWRDSVRYRTGDPADMVIGQPDFRTAAPNSDAVGGRRPSRSSLSSPRGIAVDGQGNLYVADSGNNRVLRYFRPVDQLDRVQADAVLGQADFTSTLSAIVSPSTLRRPSGVAIGVNGNVFVADAGNNRVLEYAADSPSGASATRVYGQPDFYSATAPAAVSPQTLSAPAGVAVDASFNLYVADTGANRVVVYPNVQDAPTGGAAALIVIGNDRFDTVAPNAVTARRFAGPADVALSSTGAIFVSDAGNHRVLVFPTLLFIPIADATATAVVGQRDFISSIRNWNTRDGSASAESLASPQGVYLDRRDTLYVGDAGNHRMLHLLRAANVAHAANPQASAMPRGGLVTIEGNSLSDQEASVEAPFSYGLANREVVVNDEIRSPLNSVTPARIGLQLPSSAPVGTQRLAVRVADTGELIAGKTITVTTYSPGLNTRILNQDGTVNSATNAAARGTNIRLTGSGQGAVTPPVADAEPAPEGVNTVAVPTSDGNACLASQPSLCVAIGQLFGDIQFSGLAPKMVGVWQLDVRTPTGAPAGALSMRAIINGQPSNLVTVYLR